MKSPSFKTARATTCRHRAVSEEWRRQAPSPAKSLSNWTGHYYQENSSVFGIDPSGEPLLGAYTRYLSNLSGGYSQSHSDAHLWYHGTIDFAVPTSDTQANITSTERQNWWTGYEAGGVNAGFY